MKKLLFFGVLALSLNSFGQVPFCTDETFGTIPTMPQSCNESILVNDSIFVINAYGTASLNMYDIGTGTVTPLAAPPFTSGETSMALYNNKLYCFGGYGGAVPTNIAYVYDIAGNTWNVLPNLPQSITQTSAVESNGFIYITGGTLGNTVQYFYKFDPTNNTYVSLAVPSVNRNDSKLIVYNSEIYCLGGHFYNGSQNSTNDFSKYSISNNSWSAMPPMPVELAKFNATIWGDYLYVMGGLFFDGSFSPVSSYHAFDFNNNSWVTSPNSLPSSTSQGSVVYNDTLYVTGGSIKYYCACSGFEASATQNGALLTADQSGATYQWLDCNNGYAIINGETNQSYTPAVTGNYAVEVNMNGCVDTSACFLVDYTGIEELLQTDKELVKIIDFMGRETEFKPNTPLIFIYSDGTRERVMKLEE